MKNILLILVLIILVTAGVFYIGNRNGNFSDTNQSGVQVEASFYPLYFFASVIGGEWASVTNITPAGVEPHDYEPSPRDLARIQESDLLIINGAGFEPWIANVQDDLVQNGVTIVDVSEGLSLFEGAEDEHEDEESEEENHEEELYDPHVWLDPVLAEEQVERIVDGFVAVDPSNESYYRENGDQLVSRLSDLHTKYQAELVSCQRQDFVTSHAAFSYLASRYGLTQIGIRGLSPETEPTAAELAEIVEFARDNNAEYIFFEELVSPRLSETFAREIGAQTLELSPIEGITDEEQAQGVDYFAKMEENLANLKIALACT